MKRSHAGLAKGSRGSNVSEVETKVHELIKSTGNTGIFQSDIGKTLLFPPTDIKKALVNLESKSLVKLVHSHKNRAKKIYMSVEFDPSIEISGGTWYNDGKLDVQFIEDLRTVCSHLIKELRVATIEDVTKSINEHNLVHGGVDMHRVKEILTSLVLDRSIEEFKSSGQGEYSRVPVGKSCFRIPLTTTSPAAGALVSIPCGVCPRISECTPDGVISPSTCVYYQKWLGIDF